MKDLINKAAQLIKSSKKIVVFTGAGVSTESGIPDFRSPGGLWERYTPVMYQDFLQSAESRKKYWAMGKMTYPVFSQAQPNPAHHAIVELEKMGKLYALITQNVDGLHQKAGTSEDLVLELHGTAKWVFCLECRKKYTRAEIQQWLDKGIEIPMCDSCGGILKSATVSFGQPMPELETGMAEQKSRECDLFLVVGSSLVVQPAAFMPLFAKEGGAKLIIVNNSETPHDGYADLIIRQPAGQILPKIVELAKG